jgi:hypothetical protein
VTYFWRWESGFFFGGFWFCVVFSNEGWFNFVGKWSRLKDSVFGCSVCALGLRGGLISRVSVFGKRYCFCCVVLIFNLKEKVCLVNCLCGF